MAAEAVIAADQVGQARGALAGRLKRLEADIEVSLTTAKAA